jgi:hypothetical protein
MSAELVLHILLKFNHAAVSGRRIKDVVCEKCSTRFHYELVRTGTGAAMAIFGEAKSTQAAQREADRHLSQRLEKDEELVPCPACGWINETMIKAYRRRRYRRLPWLSAVIVPAGSLASLYGSARLAGHIGSPSDIPMIVFLAGLVLSLISPLWMFAVRYGVRRCLNPNRHGPNNAKLPPGTPMALVERADPGSGALCLAPAPRPAHEGQDGWAVFVPARDRLPQVCCICLRPADTTYRAPFDVDSDGDHQIPLCAPCASHRRRRWIWTAVVTAVLNVAFFGLPAALTPGLSDLWRLLLILLGAFFGTIVALALVPSALTRPYRMKCIDGDRGIYRFRASNPGYTRLLAEQVERSGGG